MERDVEYSKEIQVDGFRYKITHPQVETAWAIGIDLLKLIGGSAAALATSGAKGADGKVNENLAVNALTSAVNQFLMKLDPSVSFGLCKRILASVEVQGRVDGDNKKVLLDQHGIKIHFHGHLGSMMKVTGHALEFTHADFLEAIVDGIAEMMKKVGAKVETIAA